MDTYEKVGYTCLGLVAFLYLLAMLGGMIALFPFGLLGFIVLFGIGALFMKVLKERMKSPEDRYYSDNIER